MNQKGEETVKVALPENLGVLILLASAVAGF
jgi:hypothetical protein